jgi:hypothetical protein
MTVYFFLAMARLWLTTVDKQTADMPCCSTRSTPYRRTVARTVTCARCFGRSARPCAALRCLALRCAALHCAAGGSVCRLISRGLQTHSAHSVEQWTAAAHRIPHRHGCAVDCWPQPTLSRNTETDCAQTGERKPTAVKARRQSARKAYEMLSVAKAKALSLRLRLFR